MNWDDLQVFLAIARAGRLSIAARRLEVEHTTVSRRLVAFEAELGVPLFYRTATGLLLTPHGQNILANAEAMERSAIGVAARAREGSAVVSGRVRLAIVPEMASHWLAAHLKAFRAEHPQIELHVLVGTRQRDLTRGEAELAVQAPRPPQQGLLAVRIARTTLALYASRALAGPRLRVTAEEDLGNLALLTYASGFQMLQEARWFQPFLGSSRVVLRTNSTHTLLEAARAGVGVAVLPRLVAREHDDLMEVSDPVAEHPVFLITHPEFRRDPKVRATAEFLKRVAQGPHGLC